MIDVEILGHIVKYKLPSSIQGSPSWHISQLQDLLTNSRRILYASFCKIFNCKRNDINKMA
jgi:hypothetical protein